LLLATVALIHLREPPALPAEPGPGELRLVTYNIMAGFGGLDGIVADLRALAADVVVLQEVERGVRAGRPIDHAGSLGDSLGMAYAFNASFTHRSCEHGVALLSRFPLSEVTEIRLPQGDGRWPRAALAARIDAPTGPFRLVGVHLTRPWKPPFSHTRARIAQLDTLRTVLADDPLPVVLAGDFNSLPFAPEGFRLRGHLDRAWSPWRDGWAASFSLQALGLPWAAVKIDHVYHDPAWECRGVWLAPPGASDHRALVADLVPPDATP
jgi:endonuclease/exonuclease/phosphatase family metal-dependent hydrolase